MRKGFTLIELLAVIVILAIILVIAVPRILKIIDSVRLEAFIKNESMIVKAAQNYTALNINLLPIEIGNTSEIKLSDLQSNNFINIIKDPKNKNITCDGYVLITKVDNSNYDYTPYLKCGDSLIVNGYINDGLVGYWKLDGNALDYSALNNHGTITGAIASLNRFGVNDTSLKLDGVDDYIDCGNNASLMPASITVIGWLKFSDTENSSWMLVDKATGGTSGSYYIYGDNLTSTRWSIFGPTGTRYDANFNTTFEKNIWYQLVGTFDATSRAMKAYVNGELKSTVNNALLGSNAANVFLGKYTSGFYLDGTIDSVKIYNRALSDSEIKHNYNVENISG